MNIKITEEQRSELWSRKSQSQIFGSVLYGTQTEDSDVDILYYYKDFTNFCGVPNNHCFQFKKDNVDEIWVGVDQFDYLLQKGDNTIFPELILFSDSYPEKYKLERCRTYNVIKSFLGFAKRDLHVGNKFGNIKRYKHAIRCLYIAQTLLDNKLPLCSEFIEKQNTIIHNTERLFQLNTDYEDIRRQMNEQYQDGRLNLYFIPKVSNPVHQLLIDSNNIKQFKYDN